MPRLAIRVTGVVQGVGFRPFAHRLAARHGLSGWVRNGSDGVRVEAQGDPAALQRFLDELRGEAPPAGRVAGIEAREIEERVEAGFHIDGSDEGGSRLPTLPPDLAVCAACAEEVDDPASRRHGYAFTNCTQCGPRLSVVKGLPYDRARTSMAGFAMCPACRAEYEDPADRRFHAEPIACPACGPHLELRARGGQVLARDASALETAARAVVDGGVLALLGLGGFQLVVDATSEAAVARLRQRKGRPAKPFAVMFPDLASILQHAVASPEEQDALRSAAAPIVLLHRQPGASLAPGVAPGIPRVGAFLPGTPLHRLLLARAARPLVCTSGNLSEEPMATGIEEGLARLGTLADLFLVHDRPVVRPVDDSVVQRAPGGMQVLRRARGFAPAPVAVSRDVSGVVAMGAQLKSTVAVGVGRDAVLSQHLGDLGGPEAAALLERTVRDLVAFHGVAPRLVAVDRHPDLASTRLGAELAAAWGVPLVSVQHHHAHVAAVMAEHGIEEEVLGLAWDGMGLGDDGSLWGGEALVVGGDGACRRVGHLRPFPLPGGDRAAREPRRAALGALWRMAGDGAWDRAAAWFPEGHREPLSRMLARGVASPETTSVGRLFDVVAAVSGLALETTFEGEAAMAVEHAAEGHAPLPGAGVPLAGGPPFVADWEPLLRRILEAGPGADAGAAAAALHRWLEDVALAMAERAALPRVVLAGGCFQNVRLLAGVRRRLESAGFLVAHAAGVPTNDGGISLGQMLVAAPRGG
jgi:hydrogenase maturation protein HypF